MIAIAYIIVFSAFACLLFLKRSLGLNSRIIIAMFLALVIGLFLNYLPLTSNKVGIEALLNFVGMVYLSLLKMLVVPLILTSVIFSIVNLEKHAAESLQKMSIMTVIMLLAMTSVASLIAIYVGKAFEIGHGLSLPQAFLSPKGEMGIYKTLLAMIPSNPVASMVNENTIAVLLFSVFFGISARLLIQSHEMEFKRFRDMIESLFLVVKKMTVIVLRLTPYGAFALLTSLFMSQGFYFLNGLFAFMVAAFVAMLIVFLMHLLILIIIGRTPWSYLKRAYVPLFVAMMTRSSFGTLPVTEETLKNKFHLKQITSSFVPSIGATIGMNACAGVFPALLVVMALNILHEPITLQLIISVMFINAVASLGISGIPGTAYIAATVTLTSLNLPYAVVAIVQGIDPIIDMGRTAVNVNGVMTTALVVDRFVYQEEVKPDPFV